MFPSTLLAAVAAGAGAIVLLMPTLAVADDDRRGRADDKGVSRPLVIGHRGASAYRPEHTLAAYALAARMGADYIEPDLVITKDGVLVARHENLINDTTNVADKPEFAARKTTKTIDGAALTGWFTEDFTLAELKTLRAKERIPELRQENTAFNGRYSVPTFQEVIDLRKRLSRELDREIGIYPETKHPTFFRGIDKPLEEPLVAALKRDGLDKKSAPVFVQSFEVSNLKMLNRALKVPIVQLFGGAASKPFDLATASPPVTYGDLARPAGLAGVAKYADGIGPPKSAIVPLVGNASQPPTTLVTDAHRAGLLVHPYTFRAENAFLANEFRLPGTPADYGNLFGELEQFLRLGIDGFFTDNPDIGVEARDDAIGEPRDR